MIHYVANQMSALFTIHKQKKAIIKTEYQRNFASLPSSHQLKIYRMPIESDLRIFLRDTLSLRLLNVLAAYPRNSRDVDVVSEAAALIIQNSPPSCNVRPRPIW